MMVKGEKKGGMKGVKGVAVGVEERKIRRKWRLRGAGGGIKQRRRRGEEGRGMLGRYEMVDEAASVY